MSQIRPKRNAKKQCNMADVSLLQESTSPRVHHSPRDAKESKFSLRQTNIYSSPVVYQHTTGKYNYQSELQDSMTASLPVSSHYLSNDVVNYEYPERWNQTRKVTTKSKSRHSSAKENITNADVGATQSTTFSSDNNRQHKFNVKKEDTLGHTYPRKKAKTSCTKTERVHAKPFPETTQIFENSAPQQVSENDDTTGSRSNKQLQNLLLSITSLLNLSDDEAQVPEKGPLVHPHELDLEPLLTLSPKISKENDYHRSERESCQIENVEPQLSTLKIVKHIRFANQRTIHPSSSISKHGQSKLRTAKPALGKTPSKQALIKTGNLANETPFSTPKPVGTIVASTPTRFSSDATVTKHKEGHEYIESIHCDVTSDDEDNLITTLDNFLHSATNHASSLGTSLRLMRIYQRLKGQDEIKRGNMLTMSRYFQRWKQIARLQRHSKHTEFQKLISATSFHTLTMVSQHFYAWRFYLLKKKFQAQELHRLHLLTKGISGLKWFHGKCKERDAWMRLRLNQKLLKSAMTQWKASFVFSQRKKLKSCFQRWKSQLFQQRTLNQLLVKKNRMDLFKSFCTWKLVHENNQVDLMAEHIWSVKVKRKILNQWKIYAAGCRIQHHHNFTASQHLRHCLFRKTFQRWTKSRKNLQVAQSMTNKKILSTWFKHWLISTRSIKSSRRMQFAAVVQIRRASLIKQSLAMWRRELKCKVLVSGSKRIKLRILFHTWRTSLLSAERKNRLADCHWNKLNLQIKFHAWKTYCDVMKRSRKQACQHLKRCTTVAPFISWKVFVQKRRLDKKRLQTYTAELNQDVCYNAFMTWRAAFNEKLLTIHWYEQWRDACVMQAVKHWKGFVRRRRFHRNHHRIILQTCFNIWKDECILCQKQISKADQFASVLMRQKIQRMFYAWHCVCQDSKIIQPLVSKKKRKTCARAFDAWRSWVAKKQRMEVLTCEFSAWKMKQNFVHWRMELDRKQAICDHLTKLNKYKMKKCLIVWKLRTISMKKSKERHQHKVHVVVECFDRWREVAYDQKIIHKDSLSWFRKVHDRETKHVVFKQWKRSLMCKRVANDLLTSKQHHLFSQTFKEWRDITKENLKMQMMEFSVKLYESNHTISSSSNSSLESSDVFTPSTKSVHDRKMLFNDSGVEMVKDSSSEVSSQFDRKSHDNNSQVILDETRTSRTLSISHHETESCDSYDHEYESINSHDFDDATSYEDSSTNKANSSTEIMTIEDLESDFDTTTCFDDAENPMLSSRTVVDLTNHDNCSVSVHDSALSDHLADMEVEGFMQQNTLSAEVLPLEGDSEQHLLHESTASNVQIDNDHVTLFHIRPKQVTDVIVQKTDGSRLRNLASFALHRLQYPTLSCAFHQWRLLVYAKKWGKNAEKQSEAFHSVKKSCNAFRKWKFQIMSLAVADNHYYQRLFEQAFRSWLQWFHQKKRVRRMHSTADELIRRRLTSVTFHLWREKYKQIREFKDALDESENQHINVERLEGQCTNFQQNTQTTMLRKCMKIWSKKHRQLALCDRHYKHKLYQRYFLHWKCYTERKQCQRTRVKAVNEILLKYRILITWQRILHQKKMAEFVHADNVKKRMRRLLTSWHQFSSVQHKNRTAAEAFIARSHQARLRLSFVLWSRRGKHKRSASNFYTSNLLRKSFSRFRQIAHEKRARNETAEMFVERNKSQSVAVYFSRWREAKYRAEMFRQFEIDRLRFLWSRWCRSLFNKRRNKGKKDNFLLRRSFDVWSKSCRKETKSRDTARQMITKWRDLAVRQRQLREMMELIEIGQRALLKETALHQWIENSVQSSQAKRHFRKSQLQRFFRTWRSRSLESLTQTVT